MNICQGLVDNARIAPERVALEFEGHSYTYADLEDLSARAAFALGEAGVNRGDRVALVLGNVPAFPVWYYAALRLGAIAVSVNTRLAEAEADYIVTDCGARVRVVVGEAASGEVKSSHGETATLPASEDGLRGSGGALRELDRIDAMAFEEMHPDEAGIILYTSGTTGFPKGATLSHRNVRAAVHAFNHLCGMTPEDRLLVMVPLFHCYGQNALLNAGLNIAATVVLQRVFDLAEARRLVREHRITKLFGVPATFQLMLDACDPSDFESVDYCFSAAAALAPRIGQRWHEKFGMPIFEGYGLTETAPFASYNHPWRHVPGSIGVPVDLVEMKVVDPETGETCPAGTPGEITVRGPNVMLGYWNRPDATAEVLRDGWFHSGDVGEMDEAGYFYIVDRIKDMIAVGGMKVFPSEVERVLFEAPAVADGAVVGLPDPTWGEKVVAFVVAEGETNEEAVRAHCLGHLAGYKVPLRVIFVEELPRNPAGKVLKRELRERPPESVLETTGAAPAPEGIREADENAEILLDRLEQAHPASRRRILTQYLQERIRILTASDEPPAVESALLETGMDSVTMVSLAGHLREQLGARIDLPATLVFDYPRIGDLAGYLVEALSLERTERTKRAGTGAGREEAPPSPGERDEPADEVAIDDMSEEEAIEALRKELKE